MWDDLPKRKSAGTRALIFFMVILTLGGIFYSGYLLFKPTKEELYLSTTSSPTNSKMINSPTPESSASVSALPSLNTSPTPSPTGTERYKVPAGESFVAASSADTNGDGKEETLVVSKISTGKYHDYILSSTGESLYDDKTLTKKPIRIMPQTYDTSESYLSWMLVFTESSGDLAFIHWNGTKYEIPGSLGI